MPHCTDEETVPEVTQIKVVNLHHTLNTTQQCITSSVFCMPFTRMGLSERQDLCFVYCYISLDRTMPGHSKCSVNMYSC